MRVSSHVYSTVFGPGYHISYVICLCFLIVAIAAILVSWLLVWRKDQRVAAKARDEELTHDLEVQRVAFPKVGTVSIPTEV